MINETANQTSPTPAPISMRVPVSVNAVPSQKRATAEAKPLPITPPKAVIAEPIAVKIALIIIKVQSSGNILLSINILNYVYNNVKF